MPGVELLNAEGTGYAKIDDVWVPKAVSWKYARTNPKFISAGRPGGLRGNYKKRIQYDKELTLTFDTLTLELLAKINGGDITTPGSKGAKFAQYIGPAVAGVFPALPNIPVVTDSEACWQLSSTGELLACKKVSGAPADSREYSIVNATGVITTAAAYTGYYYVSWGYEAVASGVTYTEDDSDTIPNVTIQIVERMHSLAEGLEGGEVRIFPNCSIISDFEDGAGADTETNSYTVTFAVGGNMVRSHILA